MIEPKNIVIGLSGGVDSAVSAYLLQQQGHCVSAIFMQNWDSEDPNCQAEEDLSYARMVSDQLQIPLTTVNFQEEYWNNVFQYFLDEYSMGRTPNPDVLCNKEIKFKAFLEHALATGSTHIATGHYATIQANDEHFELHQGCDPNKDQSYFLCLLNQHQLAHSIMPLGTMTKPHVRQIAEKIGLANWSKKDSTGICFIGERKFKNFLNQYLLTQPGKIIADNGASIGTHEGLMFYTIGQRKGLGIGGLKSFREQSWYVCEKNIEKNELIVTQNKKNPQLLRDILSAENVNWIGRQPTSAFRCQARIRHRQPLQACTVTPNAHNQSIAVTFDQPQWAIAPGQIVALYQGSQCLGGGVINT